MAAAVASLALAVGANGAVFNIVDALWLRAPVSEPSRIAVVSRVLLRPGDGNSRRGRGEPESDVFRISEGEALRRVRAFDDVAMELVATDLTADFKPRLRIGIGGPAINGTLVSSNYFQVLGIKMLGRPLTPDDDRPGVLPAVVLSDRFWRSEFGGDRQLVGRTIDLSGHAVLVRGIAPSGFLGPLIGQSTDVWMGFGALETFSASPDLPDYLMPVRLFGRLGAQAKLLEAETQSGTTLAMPVRLRTLAETRYPVRNRGRVQEDRNLLWLLGLTAALILITACVNLGTLLTSRCERRRQDASVRLALGATRGRLARLLLAESALIGILGLAAALVVFLLFQGSLVAYRLPTGVELGTVASGIGWRVMAVTAGLTFLTTLAFSVGPAWGIGEVARSSRPVRRGFGATARWSTRAVLLVGQVALSLVLLIGCALLTRTVFVALHKDYGFAVDRVLSLVLQPSLAHYASGGDGIAERRKVDYQRLVEDLRAIPGVQHVAVGSSPLGPGEADTVPPVVNVSIDGRERQVRLHIARAGIGYFDTVGMFLQAGRAFESGDVSGPKATTCIVGDELAKLLWADTRGVGRRIVINSFAAQQDLEVIGQVRDAVRAGIRSDVEPVLYLPAALPEDLSMPMLGLVIRTSVRPDALRQQLSRLVRDSFPNASQLRLETSADQIARQMAAQMLGLRLFVWFGLVALLLGGVGAYGLSANLVDLRQREMGIRLALGAEPHHLVRVIVGQSGLLIVVGVVLGTTGGLLASKGLAGLVFGISTIDWPSYVAGIGLVASGALTATWLGARRVLNVDPVVVLRRE